VKILRRVQRRLKASHINEIRAALEDLRTDVDGGSGGAWTSGAGGDVYYNGGDVGIGKSNPAVKLDMTGQIRTTSHIEAGNGTGGVALTVNDGYGNANVTWNHVGGVPDVSGNAARIEVNTDATSNARMDFELGSGVTSGVATGLNRIMTLQADGNVGIGVTNPETALDVDGTLLLRGTDRGTSLDANGTLMFNTFRNQSGDYPRLSNGYVGSIGHNRTTGNFSIVPGTNGSVGGNASFFGGGVGLHVLNNGNVGIGTSSPTAKLDVDGNIRMSTGRSLFFGTEDQSIYGDNATAYYANSNHSTVTQMIFRDKENTTYGRVYGSGNGSSFGLLDGDGQWGIQMVKDNATLFNVNNSEKMRILSNGRIGIGTTNPNGDIGVSAVSPVMSLENTASTAGAGGVVRFGHDQDGSRTPIGEIRGELSNGSAASRAGNLSFWTSNGGSLSEKMTLMANGNVGIGTTNPNSELHVSGSGFVYSKIESTNAAQDPVLALTNDAGGAAEWTMRLDKSSGNRLQFRYNNNILMSMETNGNMGIGTNNPVRPLEVVGTIRATSYEGDGSNLTGITPTGAILDSTPGNWEVASNSNSSSYINAALEVRELNNGGAQTGTNAQAPRVAFHWGGRAASQIGMGTDGVIRTFDNPGTGYEDFAAENITANGNISANGTVYQGDGKSIIQYSDAWLRLNPSNQFTNGIYAGALPLRTDGELQAGSGGSRFVVKANGNVGIGTTNPQASLHVDDINDLTLTSTNHSATFGQHNGINIAIDNNEIMARNNGSESALHLNANGGNVTIRDAQGGGTNVMFRDDGRVGIGINAPASVLHLADNNPEITFTNTAESTGTNATIGMFDDGLALSSQDPLSTYADIYIGQNRRVGIGTTSPAEDFEVNGDILADVFMQVARGSGSIAMTANDGGGNANIAFNHRALTPDQNGNAARINTNVDASTNANMEFQLKSGVTAGTSVGLETVMELREGGEVRAQKYCDENGNRCMDPSPAAGAPKMAMFDEITYSNNNLSNARNSWNTIVNQTETAGGSAVSSSDWKENCTWNTNETVPTSSASFAAGHETLRERLDWCGRIMCRVHPSLQPGSIMVDIGARGSAAPYTYNIQCVSPL